MFKLGKDILKVKNNGMKINNLDCNKSAYWFMEKEKQKQNSKASNGIMKYYHAMLLKFYCKLFYDKMFTILGIK